MCVGSEHLNLCECGCPEVVHEEDLAATMLAGAAGFQIPPRGKCTGQIPLPLNIEEVRKMVDEAKARGEDKISIVRPCDCKQFKPMFPGPMCRLP